MSWRNSAALRLTVAVAALAALAVAAKFVWARYAVVDSVASDDGVYRAELSRPWQFMENEVEIRVVRVDGLVDHTVGRICTSSVDYDFALEWTNHTLRLVYPGGRVVGTGRVQGDSMSWHAEAFSSC
jgi:hypothetical protein